MTAHRILIVEDDREMRQSIVDLMQAAGWETRALARAAEVARSLPEFDPDVILSDVRMPGMSGLDLLESLSGGPHPPLVLVTAHGDIGMAVEAMTAGAFSFLEKPYEPRRLLAILTRAAEQGRMARTNAALRERVLRLAGLDRVLLGQSPEIAALRETLADLATSRAAVLIRGETGTGKDVTARALHDLGPDGDGPYVAVNAAELTPAHLAGVVRGAAGGTLFLDEICACPLPVQAMLLRAISEGEVLPPGSDAPVRVALRVLSATNEDVGRAVDEGRLRRDLLFRLNTVELVLPPLRERPADIAQIATQFLSEALGGDGPPPDLSPDDLSALLAHDWPGNLRELRAVAERFALRARRGPVRLREVLAESGPEGTPGTLREAVAAFEREMIARAIRAQDGRMDAVAEALGIGRRTLNEKIVKLGLDKDALL